MSEWSVQTRSMRVVMVGGIYVFAHTAEPPTDGEWDKVLAVFKQASRVDRLRLFVHTMGGAPNAVQRARLNAALGGSKPRVSIVTPSAIARAAGTAIAWFTPSFRVFGPDEIDRAFEHLHADDLEKKGISRAITDFRAEIRDGGSSSIDR